MPSSKKQASINLLIKDEFGESFSEQLLTWILSYGRYIIIITQIVVLSVFFLRFKIDREHTDLRELVSQQQSILETLTDNEEEIRKVQTRLSNIKQISENNDAIIKVILYLQKHTPTDTVYSNLTLDKERITFNATSLNLRSFSYLLRELQNEQKFSDVTLENILRRDNGRVEFKISAKIKISEFI